MLQITKNDLEAAKAFINDVLVAAGHAKQRRLYYNPLLDNKDYFSNDLEAMRNIANIIIEYTKIGKQSSEDLAAAMLDTASITSILDLNYYFLRIKSNYFLPAITYKYDDLTTISPHFMYKYIAIYLKLQGAILDVSDMRNLFNMRILSLLSTTYTCINSDNHIELAKMLYDYGAYSGPTWSFVRCLPLSFSNLSAAWPNYGKTTPDFMFYNYAPNPIKQPDWSKYLPPSFIDIGFTRQIPDSILLKLPIEKGALEIFSELSAKNDLSVVTAAIPSALAEDREIANINTLYAAAYVILSLLNESNNLKLYNNRCYIVGPDGNIDAENSEYRLYFILARK